MILRSVVKVWREAIGGRRLLGRSGASLPGEPSPAFHIINCMKVREENRTLVPPAAVTISCGARYHRLVACHDNRIEARDRRRSVGEIVDEAVAAEYDNCSFDCRIPRLPIVSKRMPG